MKLILNMNTGKETTMYPSKTYGITTFPIEGEECRFNEGISNELISSLSESESLLIVEKNKASVLSGSDSELKTVYSLSIQSIIKAMDNSERLSQLIRGKIEQWVSAGANEINFCFHKAN